MSCFPRVCIHGSLMTVEYRLLNLDQVLYIGDNIWQQVCLLTVNPKPTNSHHNVQRVTVKFLILRYLTRNLCICNREALGVSQKVTTQLNQL